MGVLADLVPQAQPALFGGGVSGAGTDGATWLWRFIEFTDSAGDDIDLSAVTGVCTVETAVGGSTVATLDFDGAADGSFTIGLDEADTAGLANGATTQPRPCVWSLTLDDGDDVVQVWGAGNSKFRIFAAVS